MTPETTSGVGPLKSMWRTRGLNLNIDRGNASGSRLTPDRSSRSTSIHNGARRLPRWRSHARSW
jgi:hypothetical protein